VPLLGVLEPVLHAEVLDADGSVHKQKPGSKSQARESGPPVVVVVVVVVVVLVGPLGSGWTLRNLFGVGPKKADGIFLTLPFLPM